MTHPQRSVLARTGTLLMVLAFTAAARGQAARVDMLRIGSSGSLTTAKSAQEQAALKSLQAFIKEETGFENQVLRQSGWRELADKMAQGDLHLGFFQGHEFAWASEQQAAIRPLALAVNVYRYPVAYVVVQRGAIKDFASLKGQVVAVPARSPDFLRLFLDRESQSAGQQKADAFFGKVVAPENVEDALDDVIDGTIQAAVADRAALEAFRRRKPGRFKQLREVAKSPPALPAVVAYYEGRLEDATLRRFEKGLTTAANSERGQTILGMYRLTGFDPVPADFAKVLATTRKTYPPPAEAK